MCEWSCCSLSSFPSHSVSAALGGGTRKTPVCVCVCVCVCVQRVWGREILCGMSSMKFHKYLTILSM